MVVEDEKALDPEVIRRSVIDNPPLPGNNGVSPVSSYDANALFFFVQQVVDDIIPFGPRYKARDKQLRQFITEENIFASALGIVSSRNATFSWHLNGPPRTLNRMHDVLESANQGRGWEDLILTTSIDLYTQDSSAFWELVTEEDNERAPIIGINHLDSARCYHTNVPTAPVVYQDRLGKFHLLKRHNVVVISEMPVPIEGLTGVQYCALTRFLRAFRTRRSMSIRDFERTNGRASHQIHMVKGITTAQLQDAISRANANADSAGLMRYQDPILLGSINPTADIGHDTIDLSKAPEDYKSDEFFKQYIGQLAMAFLTDYQEFSPLPGGNLGTSTQSQILHLKNRGKGPGLFRKIITHTVNFRVMPQTVEFAFDDPDFEAEKAEAEVKKLRAQTRQIRTTSQEITPEVARQIANDDGDLRQEYMALMGEADTTSHLMVNDDSPSRAQIDEQIQAGQLPTNNSPKPTPREQTSASQGFGERVRKIITGQ